MIYDLITYQEVTLIGRYQEQSTCYRFGQLIRGWFRFVRVRYGEYLPGFSGGFDPGTERDTGLDYLVADGGIREIEEAYRNLPSLD